MKIWNYVFLAVGLSVLFEFAGISQGGGILSIMGFSLVDGVLTFGFQNSTLWTGLFAVLLAAAVGGIIVGFFTKSNTENYIILPIITGTLIIFIQVYLSLITYTMGTGTAVTPWIGGIITMIMAPIAVGFAIAAYEHFRGTD